LLLDQCRAATPAGEALNAHLLQVPRETSWRASSTGPSASCPWPFGRPRGHAREYLADFARALAAGESPDAFMARRKQVFRFLERRASAPADREGRPAPRRMMLEFRVI